MGETDGNKEILTQLVIKVDDLVTSINDYKTSTAVTQSEHNQRLMQLEAKADLLGNVQNETKSQIEVVLGEIKANRHDLRTAESNISHLNGEIEEIDKRLGSDLVGVKQDLNNVISGMRSSLDTLISRIDAKENREIGAEELKAKSRKNIMFIGALIAMVASFLSWYVTKVAHGPSVEIVKEGSK
jgi:chromosome segregation ATPase